MTTTHPYEPGASSLVGGPLCGIKAPPHLRRGWWSIGFYEQDSSPGVEHVYERRTPNDPRFYFRGTRILKAN